VLVLIYYNPELLICVETNALDGVVVVVLFQLCDDGEWYSISYYLVIMLLVEYNYDIHDKKMLVIIKAFWEWRSKLIRLC
jgi:hypothetical protein